MSTPHLALIIAYGWALSGTLINSMAWMRLMIDRLRVKARPHWLWDMASMMRIGLTIFSLSLLYPYSLRISAALAAPADVRDPPLFIASIACMAIGEACFIRASWIQGQRLPTAMWAGLGLGWSIFCMWSFR